MGTYGSLGPGPHPPFSKHLRNHLMKHGNPETWDILKHSNSFMGCFSISPVGENPAEGLQLLDQMRRCANVGFWKKKKTMNPRFLVTWQSLPKKSSSGPCRRIFALQNVLIVSTTAYLLVLFWHGCMGFITCCFLSLCDWDKFTSREKIDQKLWQTLSQTLTSEALPRMKLEGEKQFERMIMANQPPPNVPPRNEGVVRPYLRETNG